MELTESAADRSTVCTVIHARSGCVTGRDEGKSQESFWVTLLVMLKGLQVGSEEVVA